MPCTPQKNGIAERRNRTLLDMVCYMLENSLWEDALRTVAYILNQVPSKSVPKTPCEMWSRRKPNLHHICVWDYKAKVQIYNPQIKKLDPKTINDYFVNYCIGSRGSKFFCPSHTTRIVELDRVIYLKRILDLMTIMVQGSLNLEKKNVFIPSVIVPNRDFFGPMVDELTVG